jgi:hypothetical protein
MNEAWSVKPKNNMSSLSPNGNEKQETYPTVEREVLKLSTKDSEFLVATLENPPQVSEALLSLFE